MIINDDLSDDFKIDFTCFSLVWSVSETLEKLYVTDIKYLLLYRQKLLQEEKVAKVARFSSQHFLPATFFYFIKFPSI